jgi:hypothetical protein
VLYGSGVAPRAPRGVGASPRTAWSRSSSGRGSGPATAPARCCRGASGSPVPDGVRRGRCRDGPRNFLHDFANSGRHHNSPASSSRRGPSRGRGGVSDPASVPAGPVAPSGLTGLLRRCTGSHRHRFDLVGRKPARRTALAGRTRGFPSAATGCGAVAPSEHRLCGDQRTPARSHGCRSRDPGTPLGLAG